MEWVRVCAARSLLPGEMMETTLGERTFVVCNVSGVIHALDGVCPHRNGPLAQGALHGRMLVCPWHAWEFDCETGEHDYDPSIRLQKAAVKIEEGEIFIGIGGVRPEFP